MRAGSLAFIHRQFAVDQIKIASVFIHCQFGVDHRDQNWLSSSQDMPIYVFIRYTQAYTRDWVWPRCMHMPRAFIYGHMAVDQIKIGQVVLEIYPYIYLLHNRPPHPHTGGTALQKGHSALPLWPNVPSKLHQIAHIGYWEKWVNKYFIKKNNGRQKQYGTHKLVPIINISR